MIEIRRCPFVAPGAAKKGLPEFAWTRPDSGNCAVSPSKIAPCPGAVEIGEKGPCDFPGRIEKGDRAAEIGRLEASAPPLGSRPQVADMALSACRSKLRDGLGPERDRFRAELEVRVRARATVAGDDVAPRCAAVQEAGADARGRIGAKDLERLLSGFGVRMEPLQRATRG